MRRFFPFSVFVLLAVGFLTTCDFLDPSSKDAGEIHVFLNGEEILNNGEVDMGFSEDGSPLGIELEIQNHGEGDLRLTSEVYIQAENGEFSVSQQPDSNIPPRSSSRIAVEFQPADAGVKEGSLIIESNDELLSAYYINLHASSGVSGESSSFRVELSEMSMDSMFTAVTQAANGDVYLAGKKHVTGNEYDIFVIKVDSTGHLDTGFGNQGYFTFQGRAGTSSYVRNLILIESAGNVEKILVGGRTFLGSQSTSQYDATIIQLNANGTIDNSFGSGGYYIVENIYDRASDGWIARDPATGNIFVNGGEVKEQSSLYDNRMYRLTSAGVLDASFNSTGYIDINPYGWTDYSRPPWVCSGALYVPTYSFVYGNNDKAYAGILKYSLNGVLDAAFGDTNSGTTNYGDTNSGKNGWAMWPAYNESSTQGADAANYMIETSDGGFLLTGRDAQPESGVSQRGFVARFASNGSLVGSFGTNGAFLDSAGSGSVSCTNHFIATDSTGNIYVRGMDVANDRTYVYKLSSSGDLDSDFGVDGYIYEDDYHLFMYSVTVTSGDDVLIIGQDLFGGYPLAYVFDSNGIPK